MLRPQDRRGQSQVSAKWVSAKTGTSANWNQLPRGRGSAEGPLLGSTRRTGGKQEAASSSSSFDLSGSLWRPLVETSG